MAQDEASDSANVNKSGVFMEIKKPQSDRDSIIVTSKIAINASFEIVWNIMTDYGNFGDVIPGLVSCEVIDKKDNFARVHQVSEQILMLGMKIRTKMILDCFEKDIEISPSRKKRDIEFKMVESNLQSFQGKWIIEQVINPESEGNDSLPDSEFETTLAYTADLKPPAWLPVQLIEGAMSREIEANLLSIRAKAERIINGTA